MFYDNRRHELFNDRGGLGYDDSGHGEVTKNSPFRGQDYMIPYMVGKLVPNPTYYTRGLVKYVPGRGYFGAVLSQNGDKFVTSPPLSIVERVRACSCFMLECSLFRVE